MLQYTEVYCDRQEGHKAGVYREAGSRHGQPGAWHIAFDTATRAATRPAERL